MLSKLRLHWPIWLRPARDVVTFLLTDIENSSRGWEINSDAMRRAMELHDCILTEAIERNSGTVLTNHGEGDSFFAVFQLPSEAVSAARAIQCEMMTRSWPATTRPRVRMALHSGETGGDYRGRPANRCARVRALAEGDQVLLTAITAQLVREATSDDVTLLDLGWRDLRDLGPERIFELAPEPPTASL